MAKLQDGTRIYGNATIDSTVYVSNVNLTVTGSQITFADASTQSTAGMVPGPIFMIYLNANSDPFGMSINDSVMTKVEYDTILIDSNNAWDGENFWYAMPENGFYSITLTGSWNITSTIQAALFVDGTDAPVRHIWFGPGQTVFSGTTISSFNQGDKLYVGVEQQSGAPTIFFGGTSSSMFTISYIRPLAG